MACHRNAVSHTDRFADGLALCAGRPADGRLGGPGGRPYDSAVAACCFGRCTDLWHRLIRAGRFEIRRFEGYASGGAAALKSQADYRKLTGLARVTQMSLTVGVIIPIYNRGRFVDHAI